MNGVQNQLVNGFFDDDEKKKKYKIRWAFVKHDDITNHSLSHDHLECFV